MRTQDLLDFCYRPIILCTALLLSGAALAQTAAAPAALTAQPAIHTAASTLAPLLGAARAGKRIVAVGDYGIILLSDDEGQHFRQAAAVPVSSTLTSVSFIDAENGWAAGNWGVILHSTDGGEHWLVQRTDTMVDRPLFSIYFIDGSDGVAVGLWGLMLTTRDGGKNWLADNLPPPPGGGKADCNLFRIFASSKGSLFVTAERGLVLRSDDHGHHWRYAQTGYKGSFWTGLSTRSGTLIVAGLRGTVYRSADDGQSWQPVSSAIKSSVTDMVETDSGLVAVGLDGLRLDSHDDGLSFTAQQRDDRLPLTAVVAGSSPGALVLFSQKGVVSSALPKPLR
ncbi:photosystem II stability/assembly factor-like uncharacterized protein [Oxalobacteraceae bacterium GrIS 2.11]